MHRELHRALTKEQPGNENDLEPSTTIAAGKLETTKTQFSPPDQVFVNVSDSVAILAWKHYRAKC